MGEGSVKAQFLVVYKNDGDSVLAVFKHLGDELKSCIKVKKITSAVILVTADGNYNLIIFGKGSLYK